MKRLLFVPRTAEGHGLGHLRRCLELAQALGPDSRVFAGDQPDRCADLVAKLGFDSSLLTADARGDLFDAVIFDFRATAADHPLGLAFGYSRCLALDEGGEMRRFAGMLIDCLPNLFRTIPANRSEHAWITDRSDEQAQKPWPEPRRWKPSQPILLTFGAEDPAGLGPVMFRFLRDQGISPGTITIIQGPASRTGGHYPGARLIVAPRTLAPYLREAALVVTTFGLTAWEAMREGAQVLLVNPSGYHESLARNAGLPSLGVKQPSVRLWRRFVARCVQPYSAARQHEVAVRKPEMQPQTGSLSAFLASLSLPSVDACPACGGRAAKVLHRNKLRTFVRCTSCSLIRQYNYGPARGAYSDDYFFEEYKAQYGRTYLEDFASIEASGSRRVGDILGVIGRKNGTGASLLDIGCAFGPFLSAAKKAGFDCSGSDINQSAVRHVQQVLGIPAFVGDLTNPGVAEWGQARDVVSMWFVIEHLPNLEAVISLVHGLLKPGGVFAFSTPSASGISARRNPAAFFDNSPDDHLTIWEPGRVQKVLARHGFEVRQVNVTGHHPERFWPQPKAGSLHWKMAGAASRLFGLGDTFECIAQKKERG